MFRGNARARPAYSWYRTPVNASGVSTGPSVLVTVWFGAAPPTNPAAYGLILIDSDGGGRLS